ncbi:hypothetical protein ILFOPFJJ_06660 [Ensifer psoraleae]|uniref:hypothetical protein n=1 Tax=Sinorhizobium psoraleae TaxID=520838 RepID=UPI001569B32B|nr:hypothetical protein [Sinorhizobium psoraleae]NRP75737.1 hypothetical protein [Sinorhizobium psoraleae]
MSDHCVFVADDADIRQGDVIRRIETANVDWQTWGFIITADCDIAQSKAGDRFTWLEIVRSDQFLDAYWAPEQLRRLVDKQTRPACDGLNGLIKRTGLQLSEVDGPALHAWLSEATADEIVGAIKPPKSADAKLLATLSALRLALGHDGERAGMTCLRKAWTLLGRDEKAQRAAIREAFDADRGFPDFVLIPEIPGTEGYGFVILLRAISSVYGKDLFKTEADARINGQPHAFHRIGRFSDGLRFSVAQKLAFLFSRIGMSTQFEDACDAATELLVDTIYQK